MPRLPAHLTSALREATVTVGHAGLIRSLKPVELQGLTCFGP